jgi:hypothetical protein
MFTSKTPSYFLQASPSSADVQGALPAADATSAAAAAAAAAAPLSPLAAQALHVHSGNQDVTFFEWLELLCRCLRRTLLRASFALCSSRAGAAGRAWGSAWLCVNASSKRDALRHVVSLCR